MFWYGPGHIAPAGVVDRPVTLAGIAPTQAALLGFPFATRDGSPMREAIAGNDTPPKLVVTMVWDAAGRNVLDRWPDDWPYLESLIPQGAWYERATVGTSPTSTAQTHATIGTGTFPDDHGIVAHRLRIGDELTTPWSLGPAYLIDPTLADLYDIAMGNEPVVGELGTVSIHLGMLGHGAMWGGGDQDIAVIREKVGATTRSERRGSSGTSPPSFSRTTDSRTTSTRSRGFEDDVRAVDAADGQIDGRWRANEIAPLLSGFDTPARIPYQTRVLDGTDLARGLRRRRRARPALRELQDDRLHQPRVDREQPRDEGRGPVAGRAARGARRLPRRDRRRGRVGARADGRPRLDPRSRHQRRVPDLGDPDRLRDQRDLRHRRRRRSPGRTGPADPGVRERSRAASRTGTRSTR